MRSFQSFRLESGPLVCLVEQSKASRTGGFAEVRREAALRAADEPFDENFFSRSRVTTRSFRLAISNLRSSKGMVLLLYGQQVSCCC